MFATRCLFLLCLIAAFLPDASAQTAFNDAVRGYAYSDSAGSLQFEHLYNRAGGDVISLHPSTGVYTIRFHPATSQLNSTDGSPGRTTPQGGEPIYIQPKFVPIAAWAGSSTSGCSIEAYGVGVTQTFSFYPWATMHCFDEFGNPLNAWHQFMLVDAGGDNGTNAKLAFADSLEAQPSGNLLDLSEEETTHNPAGGSTILTRLGTGQYHVTFNGLGAVMEAGSTVQVIAVSDEAHTCRVDDWTLHFAGSSNARARVYCYGLPGQGLEDSRFVLLLTSTEDSATTAASLEASGFGSPSNWTSISGSNVHNPHGDVQIRWRIDGYEVRFQWPGDSAGGVAFVSPISSILHNCTNSSPYRDSSDPEDYLRVNVTCRNHNSDTSMGAFNLLLTQVPPLPLPDLLFTDRFEP